MNPQVASKRFGRRMPGGAADADPALRSVVERVQPLTKHVERAADYPEAIAIRSGAQYHLVRMDDIEWIEADGNYAKLHAIGHSRLVTKSLATLERDVLDPGRFVRVHRSAIVNLSRIVSFESPMRGELVIVLRGGQRVQCSRRFRDRLEAKVFFTT